MEEKRTINRDMTIGEILQIEPMIANILMGHGMHCISCGAAVGETLEEACYVHGFEDDFIDTMVDQINEFLGGADVSGS